MPLAPELQRAADIRTAIETDKLATLQARRRIAELLIEVIRNQPERHTDLEVCHMVAQLAPAHAQLWVRLNGTEEA